MNRMKKTKIIIIVAILIGGLVISCRGRLIIGALSHEETVIKNFNGEIIYAREEPFAGWRGEISFAGIVVGNGICVAYYRPADIALERLYVTGFRFNRTFLRVESTG